MQMRQKQMDCLNIQNESSTNEAHDGLTGYSELRGDEHGWPGVIDLKKLPFHNGTPMGRGQSER